MDKFINELRETKVISKDDIETLKNYINKKYDENESTARAKMLSNTIHNILYKKLDGIPDAYKSSIKVNTLKNTFAKNKTLITLYDVFNSCLSENDLKTNCTSTLTNWINLNISDNIKEEDLKAYLNNEIKCTSQYKIENINNSIPITPNDIDNNNATVIVNNKFLNSLNFTLKYFKNFQFNNRIVITFIIIFFIITFYPISKFAYNISSKNNFKLYSYKPKDSSKSSLDYTNSKFPNTHLPEYMRYKNINELKLKFFLVNHKSLLAKEPYFATVISVAKEFNLNPLVFFAITGQEQNFVPENTKNSSKIANNPFNVFHSWQEYNTDIKDSSKIAARTVINLSKDMPKDSDPFLWIGKNYAEDPNWGKGVESIFKDLNEKCK
jgi:hypothetical protein